jgi:hypothetical protein
LLLNSSSLCSVSLPGCLFIFSFPFMYLFHKGFADQELLPSSWVYGAHFQVGTEVYEMSCQPLLSTYLILNSGPERYFHLFYFFLSLFYFCLTFYICSSHLLQLVCKLFESLHGDSTPSIDYKNIHWINSNSIPLSHVVAMCL